MSKHNNIYLNIPLLQRHAMFYAKNYCTTTMLSLYEKFKSKTSHTYTYFLEKMRQEWNNKNRGGPVITEDEEKENTELRKQVLHFYLNQINPQTKTTDHILYHKAFELINLRQEPPDHKRWISLIYAATQSGKTFLAIALINIYLSLGYVPLFIVKATNDKKQLCRRFVKDTRKLTKYLVNKGFSMNCLSIYEKPLYMDSKTKNREEFHNNLQACLNGSRRRLIICIHRSNHLDRILDNLSPGHDSKMILFIDEAHKLGGYKKIGETLHGDDLHNENNKYETSLLQIKNSSVKIFLITATPQDILISEPNLYTDSIVIIPTGVNYRGLSRWEFELFDDKNDEDIKIKVDSDTVGIPTSFMNMMSKLSKTKPINRTNKFGIKDKHPIIVLAKYEPINVRQQMTLKTFRTDTVPVNANHKDIIDANWVVMVFNQFGVNLFHNSLKHETITLENEIVNDKYGSGEFLFKKSEIGEIWDWLAHNGGVERFPHILTIAYKAAEEGISFCSTWTGKIETDANWHILFAFFGLGQTTTSANVEQAMGRVNGNHGDDITPVIYCSLRDKKKLLKGHTLHFEQIKALANISLMEGDVRIMEFVRKLPIFSNRVPRDCYNIKYARKELNTLVNSNSKMEEESFVRHKKALSTLQIINPEEYDPTEELRTSFSKLMKTENEEDSNSNWVKMKKCYNKHGKLYKIINAFIENKLISLSTEQLTSVCDGSFKYDNYNHWDMGKHAKYYIIEPCKYGKWNIRYEALDALGINNLIYTQ